MTRAGACRLPADPLLLDDVLPLLLPPAEGARGGLPIGALADLAVYTLDEESSDHATRASPPTKTVCGRHCKGSGEADKPPILAQAAACFFPSAGEQPKRI
eukprot:gene6078-biopygen5823